MGTGTQGDRGGDAIGALRCKKRVGQSPYSGSAQVPRVRRTRYGPVNISFENEDEDEGGHDSADARTPPAGWANCHWRGTAAARSKEVWRDALWIPEVESRFSILVLNGPSSPGALLPYSGYKCTVD